MQEIYGFLEKYWAPKPKRKSQEDVGDAEKENDGEPEGPENDSIQPVSYPSPVLQDSSGFAPVRTPKKGQGDGERLDQHLAWTLGGELPKTMSPQSPWTNSFTGDDGDELAALESELAQLAILVGTHTCLSKSCCFIFVNDSNLYHWVHIPERAQDCNG